MENKTLATAICKIRKEKKETDLRPQFLDMHAWRQFLNQLVILHVFNKIN